MRVDIGGGSAPAKGYENLDPIHGRGEWRRRIQQGIPVPDGHLEAARASHVLEHIPAGQVRIDVFNDVWRALVSGGWFEVIVPLIANERDMRVNWQAIADPTHVSWWMHASFEYFTGKLTPQADYGIRYWAWDETAPGGGWTDDGAIGRAVLVKP